MSAADCYCSRIGLSQGMKCESKTTVAVLLTALLPAMLLGATDVKVDCKDPGGWRFDVTTTSPETGVEVVRVVAKSDVEAPPPKFSVKWFVSQKDIHHVWSLWGQTLFAMLKIFNG